MPVRLAYLVSRFPKTSETFIVREINELERLGAEVELFTLVREVGEIVHPEARLLAERLRWSRPLSWEVLTAQLHWLRRRPGRYLSAWWRALRGNVGSWRFLLRALVVVPLAATFARKAKALNIDHIHAHWATHPALAASTMALLTDRPYSVTAHAHDLYVDRTMLEEKLRGASFVVTISDHNVALLRRLYGDALADNVHVVRCGIDLDQYQRTGPPAPRTAGVEIICVASLQEYKGHTFLLDACARLRRAGLDFHCVLVGEGEERANLAHRVAELGLAEHVELVGAQPSDRVLALVAEADIFVLPSVTARSGKKEGVPVALMEAMALEVACVASDVSGIGELVDHGRTGLLVSERDPAALADAILELAADPSRRATLGQEGRARVSEAFNLREQVAKLGTLFGLPGAALTDQQSPRRLTQGQTTR